MKRTVKMSETDGMECQKRTVSGCVTVDMSIY